MLKQSPNGGNQSDQFSKKRSNLKHTWNILKDPKGDTRQGKEKKQKPTCPHLQSNQRKKKDPTKWKDHQLYMYQPKTTTYTKEKEVSSPCIINHFEK